MSKLDGLKAKLESGEVVFGSTFSDVNNPYLPRIFCSAGVDFMLFDGEHGSFMPELALDMLQQCRACGLPSIMRVQDCEYHCISKCLDMGADGILIPRTETEEQVKLAIESMRFYPRGRKGAGGMGLLRPGENCDDFNNNRLLFLQTESPCGIRNLPTLLEKYGDEVAGVIIGPSDLGIMSGEGLLAAESQKVQEEIKEVIAICKAKKKAVGMFLLVPQMRKWIEAGMNIVWCETDTMLLRRGVMAAMDEIKDLRTAK